MIIIIWFSVLVLIPLIIAYAEDKYKKHMVEVNCWWKNENMPQILRQSKLFLNESTVCIEYPIKIKGRVDQVYLTPNNRLILVDTKVRKCHKVFSSDIFQLSAYALILSRQYKLEVEKFGYIRTVTITKSVKDVRYIKTKLINDESIINAYKGSMLIN